MAAYAARTFLQHKHSLNAASKPPRLTRVFQLWADKLAEAQAAAKQQRQARHSTKARRREEQADCVCFDSARTVHATVHAAVRAGNGVNSTSSVEMA